ncbi:helix-turn-helix domain-containing protein [Streptosporangium soli]|nr:helix-turn-helix domain-containing protein [Streptosporangium sp. KLBMP 9127]
MSATAEYMSVPAAELVIVGHFDRTPGYAVRRAGGAPSWLLLWTEAGAGRVEQGERAFITGPGDLVVLGSRAAHAYRIAPDATRWRFWWAHFQPRPAWLSWLGPYATTARCHLVPGVPPAAGDRIGRVFRRANADAKWSGHGVPPEPSTSPDRPAVAATSGARELVLGALEEVLLLATAASGPAEAGDPRIRHAEALIAAEPDAPHTVASLARSVALSPSRFAHLFALQTRRTPMRAVREARVRHAARLLEVTDMDVGQVASASGFASPFHFSRAFSQEYGLPPREYRARLRRPDPKV